MSDTTARDNRAAIAYAMLSMGWPELRIREKVALFQQWPDDDNEDGELLFMLFGDALAMPYTPENDVKLDEVFRVADERLRELKRQSENPQ